MREILDFDDRDENQTSHLISSLHPHIKFSDLQTSEMNSALSRHHLHSSLSAHVSSDYGRASVRRPSSIKAFCHRTKVALRGELCRDTQLFMHFIHLGEKKDDQSECRFCKNVVSLFCFAVYIRVHTIADTHTHR